MDFEDDYTNHGDEESENTPHCIKRFEEQTPEVNRDELLAKINARAKARAHKKLIESEKIYVSGLVESVEEVKASKKDKKRKKKTSFVVDDEDDDKDKELKKIKTEETTNTDNVNSLDSNNEIKTVSPSIKDELSCGMPAKQLRRIAKNRRNHMKRKLMKTQTVGGFTILGEVQAEKKETVKRVLPHWLQHPVIVSRSFSEGSKPLEEVFNLSLIMKKKLKQNGIESLFPIQEAVVATMLRMPAHFSMRYQPRDICVSAPTGSGKTLAYVLPIVEALKDRVVPKIRALILLPVQELAKQVFKVFANYGGAYGLKIGNAVGQKTFEKEQETLVEKSYGEYVSKIDILVATPGKLVDHIALTPGFDLSHLRYFVLDEADRLLSSDGGAVVAEIERAINKFSTPKPETLGSTPLYNCPTDGDVVLPNYPMQRLLFSATLSNDPEQLQQVSLQKPMLFTIVGEEKKDKPKNEVVGQYTRPEELTEQYVVSAIDVKPLVLHHLILVQDWKKTIVFTKSKESTNKLALLLGFLANDRYTVAEFSSNKGKERSQIISQFTDGKINVLVSSDAIARGLDVADIEHVVSYDLTSHNTYIHRIGRTARAGREGTALSLITKNELRDLHKLTTGAALLKEITVENCDLEAYESTYIEALEKMKDIVSHQNESSKMMINKKPKKRKCDE